MIPLHFPPAVAEHDELFHLELCIAQRADELYRLDNGFNPERDFWNEAEQEIWSAFHASVNAVYTSSGMT